MDQQKTETKNLINCADLFGEQKKIKFESFVNEKDPYNINNMEHVNIETGEITQNAYEPAPADLDLIFKNFKEPHSPSSAKDNQTLNEYCLAIGEWASDKPFINFGLYNTALKKDVSVVLGLIKHIKYRNIVFLSIKELCTLFELKDNKNLDRKLKRLASRNVIQYDKMDRSNYKIVMNPKIFYRLGKGIGKKEAYNYMCHFPCWELDATEELIRYEQQQQQQREKLEYVHYDFTPTPVTDEKELVWQEIDDKIEMLMKKDCSYRLKRVLNTSHQKFLVDYCGLSLS